MDVREKQSSGKRLIDADKLLTNAVTISNSEGQAIWSAVSTIDILAAPIVDVVDIVRCMDCKYHEDTSVTGFKHCCLIGKTVRYNDFCSYGKLKEGSDNG